MQDTLLYHGSPLTWDPVNWANVARTLERIARDGASELVRLEPGDWTRYELWITAPPVADDGAGVFLVARVRGGERGPHIVYHGSGEDPACPMKIAVLAEGNQWSEMFLTWWLDGLLLRLANLCAKEANV